MATKLLKVFEVTQENFKRVWLELLVKYGLKLNLTNKEYDVLEASLEYQIVGTKERKAIKNLLNVSAQVITNNLHKLKSKNLLIYDKEKNCFKTTLSKKIPNTIDQLQTMALGFKIINTNTNEERRSETKELSL